MFGGGKALKWGEQSTIADVLSILISRAPKLLGQDWLQRVVFIHGASEERNMIITMADEYAVVCAKLGYCIEFLLFKGLIFLVFFWGVWQGQV